MACRDLRQATRFFAAIRMTAFGDYAVHLGNPPLDVLYAGKTQGEIEAAGSGRVTDHHTLIVLTAAKRTARPTDSLVNAAIINRDSRIL
jgi:hypothetical protein